MDKFKKLNRSEMKAYVGGVFQQCNCKDECKSDDDCEGNMDCTQTVTCPTGPSCNYRICSGKI